MFEYRCAILGVVDGDTVDVDIDLGFGVWLRNERVRIMGIDTPESRTSNEVEKLFGLAAKKRLAEILGEKAILRTQKPGKSDEKFGRILGDFVIGEKTAAGMLIVAIAPIKMTKIMNFRTHLKLKCWKLCLISKRLKIFINSKKYILKIIED